jgi:hypothetical protein
MSIILINTWLFHFTRTYQHKYRRTYAQAHTHTCVNTTVGACRFAHMVLQGARLGATELAAIIGGVLSEKDILRGVLGKEVGGRASLLLRLACLAQRAAGKFGLWWLWVDLISSEPKAYNDCRAVFNRGSPRQHDAYNCAYGRAPHFLCA